MKRVAVLALMMLFLLPVAVAEDTTGKTGQIVWRAQYQGNDIITITQSTAANGDDVFEVWVDATKMYQEFPLNSRGYNGSFFISRVREIRPEQTADDACKGLGLRDPASIYRAPKVVYGVSLKRGETWIFLEVRELGENYLIVVTTIIPQPPNEGQPDSKEL